MLTDELDNQFVKLISDMCMDGILVIDENEKIIFINDNYCGYLGLPKDKIIGKHVHDIIKNSKLPHILKTGERDSNVVHSLLAEQKFKGERLVFVNRQPIYVDGKIKGAIGYIKFLDTTLEIYNAYSVMCERVEYYKKELEKCPPNTKALDKIIGDSYSITAVKNIVKRVTKTDFSVLLMGETGTGKDMFANALHYMSKRYNQPFIKINCAALPSNLIESELFGYAEGAFTGALKGGKPGKFEVANGGTLFLDEIGELALDMQAKLLRVLQDGEFERIGDNKIMSVDVRIIAASNQNLEQKVNDGTFRSDLFYRLNVIQIVIPPLRERKSDIPQLIQYFLKNLNKANDSTVKITEAAVDAISHLQLSGNVRELKNIVDRCYVFCENDVIDKIDVESFIKPLVLCEPASQTANAIKPEVIRQALRDCNNNITKASEQLGIHRMTLYRKIKKYGITVA